MIRVPLFLDPQKALIAFDGTPVFGLPLWVVGVSHVGVTARAKLVDVPFEQVYVSFPALFSRVEIEATQYEQVSLSVCRVDGRTFQSKLIGLTWK